MESAPRTPLPQDAAPLAAVDAWLADAVGAAAYRNPLAMALATADANGAPAVRMVLLKGFSAAEAYADFYTNYESRKALELAANARAAGVLYWERLGRQLRLCGAVTRAPEADSDAYFASRPLGSRLNACVSDQSRPIADFDLLRQRGERLRASLETSGEDCRRPGHWGGFRIWLDEIEFWVEGGDRFHERVRYTRRLSPRTGPGPAFAGGAWTRTLLQP